MKLALLWRREAARHVALSAVIMVLSFWAMARLAPHAPGWAKTADTVWATIDQPVRNYFAAHAQGLPVTAAAIYSLWQAAGLASLILGFFRLSAARLTWIVWGAATVAAVWLGSPEPGRQVAAGIALLAWAALSSLALRGLRLSRPAFVHVDVHNQAPPAPAVEVRAEIHMPKPTPSHYAPYRPPFLPPSPN
ncbi:hypothetical protein [Streptomyces sp. NPDC057413]|uniref:hypothetical protein n=1 Tax=Streptomyces sp. NPDC057413 TaxID=3346124 RepID=UPI003694FFC0